MHRSGSSSFSGFVDIYGHINNYSSCIELNRATSIASGRRIFIALVVRFAGVYKYGELDRRNEESPRPWKTRRCVIDTLLRIPKLHLAQANGGRRDGCVIPKRIARERILRLFQYCAQVAK